MTTPHRNTPDHDCTCDTDYRCPPCRKHDREDWEAEQDAERAWELDPASKFPSDVEAWMNHA